MRLEKEAEHRPLLQEGDSIRAVIQAKLSERRLFYEQAHLHIEVNDEETDVAKLISEHQLEITGH
jgi:shikimate kinase